MIMYYNRHTITTFQDLLQIIWSLEIKLHTTEIQINFLGFVVVIVKKIISSAKFPTMRKGVPLLQIGISKRSW